MSAGRVTSVFPLGTPPCIRGYGACPLSATHGQLSIDRRGITPSTIIADAQSRQSLCTYNPAVLPRNQRPMRLSRRTELFDCDQHIFELKIDGFRALAHIEAGKGELISGNGNVFRGFADLATWIAEHPHVESAVLGDCLHRRCRSAGVP